MACCASNQYPVYLSDQQRQELEEICRNGRSAAKTIRHARILLLSDHRRPGGRLYGHQIAEIMGVHLNTVARTRRRFTQEGVAPALNRKPRSTPPRPPILDGVAEAHLVAICCSKAPEGRKHWTMQLLASQLKKRQIVTQISRETVRRCLKKRFEALA